MIDQSQEFKDADVVFALASSPNLAHKVQGVCFAARSSGLYRSEDSGLTWQFLYDSLDVNQPLATTAIALAPNYGQGADHTIFAGVTGGILRSEDGGETWYATALLSPPPVISVLAVSPNFINDGILLAGTLEDGMFRSDDRGSHWSTWNFGLLDLNVLSLAISPAFANDETVFIGTESGIFRSTNGGRAWHEIDFPMDFSPVLSLALSPFYVDDGILFAGTESYGLFYSSDQGSTWTRLAKDRIVNAVNTITLSPDFPTKPHLVILLDDVLYVSRDYGESWHDWKLGFSPSIGITCILAPQGIDAEEPLLAGLVDGSVYWV